MRVIDSLSYPGKTINEDCLIITDKCIAVLDGSSGLGGSDFGAEQFVTEFRSRFIECIEDGMSLTDSVNSVISNIKQRMFIDPSAIPPSASGLFVYEDDDSVDILNIGDCTGYLYTNSGIIRVFSDEVSRFDQQVINSMLFEREKTGKNIIDIVAQDNIQQMLMDNRRRMNAPDGYRILSVNMSPVSDSDIVSYDKSTIDEIVLFSDGFMAKEEELKSQNRDLEALYKSLRTREREDPFFNKHPRFKMSDDASAIVIKIQ